MAVVTRYGSAYQQPGIPANQISAVRAEGKLTTILSSVGVVNTDSIGSKLMIGKIPSYACIVPALSYFINGAITGVADLDLGLFKNDGTLVDVDLLQDGISVAAAGGPTLFSANAAAAINGAGNLGVPLWAVAGAAADPGAMYDVVATLNAAATASASVAFCIAYSKK